MIRKAVEMESLQFVGCSWFIGLIGLGFRFTRNKFTETELCVHPCPSPVSSSTHLDAPGVHSLADGDDINRGDVLLTMAQVRQLITIKEQSTEEIATIWLTTAEMGFSLTAESNEVTCPKDAREGKVSDRFLAPAIPRFATSALVVDEQVEDLTQPINEARRQQRACTGDGARSPRPQRVRTSECKHARRPRSQTGLQG